MELTQEYLKQCLDYNPETGVFTWKTRPVEHFKNIGIANNINSRYAGKVAKTKANYGYIKIGICGKEYKAHRLAWLYVHGVMPENEIDHVNNITNDNRLINLRLASHSENMQNLKKCQKNNKHGFIGVSYRKEINKFKARIMLNRFQYHLGYFETAQEAHEAYIKAKRELHGHNTL